MKPLSPLNKYQTILFYLLCITLTALTTTIVLSLINHIEWKQLF